MNKFIMSYSCGKDSTLALYRMINKGNIPVALITTINKYKKKSCFHGVSVNLIYEISKSLDIPVLLIEVAKQFESYVNGDISLEDSINKVVDNLDLYLSE